MWRFQIIVERLLIDAVGRDASDADIKKAYRVGRAPRQNVRSRAERSRDCPKSIIRI